MCPGLVPGQVSPQLHPQESHQRLQVGETALLAALHILQTEAPGARLLRALATNLPAAQQEGTVSLWQVSPFQPRTNLTSAPD